MVGGDIASIVRSLTPGERVFLPGSTGEVPSLTEALCADGAPALAITASFVPGINPSPVGRLPEGSRFANPFAIGARGAQASFAMSHLPVSYGSFAAHLAGASFDTCIVHVSTPDRNGRASLGAAVEFAPLAMRAARRLVAVVNANVPAISGSPSIDLSDADLVVETDEALRQYDVGAPSAQSDAIAGHVARFVTDGSALQVGLGKVPDALLRMVRDRKRLRLHSGMLSDGTRQLADAGALDDDFRHLSCVHVGTSSYYDWLAGREGFAVVGCEISHAAATLAGLAGLVAVNSAMAVDLFGQANLETLDGRAVSGVGGAADFARGASLAPGGVSIVALPATSGKGAVSRIVPSLSGIVSLPRQDIGVVVTEYGAADLRGLSVMERAERLIAIADPSHRGALADAWRDIAHDL